MKTHSRFLLAVALAAVLAQWAVYPGAWKHVGAGDHLVKNPDRMVSSVDSVRAHALLLQAVAVRGRLR